MTKSRKTRVMMGPEAHIKYLKNAYKNLFRKLNRNEPLWRWRLKGQYYAGT
jgi:hypothetical protein